MFEHVFHSDNYAFSLYAIPTLLTSVLVLLLGSRVLSRERPSLGTVLFFILTLPLSLWLVSFTMMFCARDAVSALFWAKAAYLGIPFVAPTWYHLTAAILGIPNRNKLLITTLWIIGAAFSIVGVLSDSLITGVHRFSFGYYPQYGWLGAPFIAFFAGCMCVALYTFLTKWRSQEHGIPARRAFLLMSGFLVAVIAGVDILPMYGIAIYPFGYIPVLIFFAISAWTIKRYHLVDITPSYAAQQIIHTMADALFVCDSAGHIRIVNHAVQSMFGFDPEELIGKSIDTLTDPDSTVANAERLKHALQKGTLRDQERVFRRKGDSRPVEVSLSVSPLDVGGADIGSVIIARDITQRKAAEDELKKTVSLLQSTLESTADGILVVDLNGRISAFNERFATMWNIPDDMLKQGSDQPALDFARGLAKDPAAFAERVSEIYRTPESESVDFIELSDGRVLERHSIPQRLEGRISGRVWTFRDITERRLALNAIRSSEERYRDLFERNLAGVYRATLDGGIIDCNDAYARIFGFTSRDEMVRRNTRDLYVNVAERDEIVDLLKEVGNLTNLELSFRRRDGGKVWAIENVSMLPMDEGPILQGTLVDITDRKLAEEQIAFQAYHDVLTCLPNRMLFRDRLTVALAQAERSNEMVGVMYLDLDRFKTINDTLGHTTGDELLLIVAERLKNCVRQTDTVARVGGDEFNILVTNLVDNRDVPRLAQKIIETISQPLTIEGHELYASTSIGIAVYPSDGTDAETLLKNSDSALYRAKDLGRNNYQLCTPEMNRRAAERMQLENSLRRSIDRGHFVLHYQPVVNLVSGRVMAMEALLRWNHPDRGLTYPADFISIAEETRLILPLGEWVLETACRQAVAWQNSGMPGIRIAVNLSARQFQQPDLLAAVERTLVETSLAPELLELEITESTAAQNTQLTIGVLNDLRKMGVRISIDDFGTGYSSFSYLTRFPITTLKIDQSFVRNVNSDPGKGAVVSGVIAIARSLDLNVIAEGVQTEAELAFLRDRECEEMQGFLFSRPLTAQAVAKAAASTWQFPAEHTAIN